MAKPTVKPFPIVWPVLTATRKSTKWFNKDLDVLREDLRLAFMAQEGAGVRKQDVRAATAAALAANTPSGSGIGKILTADINGALGNIDSVAVEVGDRVLVKDEVDTAQNGIYTVTDLGSASTPWILTRALDFDEDAEVLFGDRIVPIEGTINGDVLFQLQTAGALVVDTSSLIFAAALIPSVAVQFASAPAGQLGTLYCVEFNVPASNPADTDVPLPEGTWRFINGHLLPLSGGPGTPGETAQFKKTAAALSDAVDLDTIVDNAVVPIGTIDPANRSFVGGTDVLRVTTVGAAHQELEAVAYFRRVG